MSYVPNNPNVFGAAYNGCMYGIAANRAALSDTNESDFVNPAIIAGAFAQAIDTIWGSVTVANQLDVGVITGACNDYWQRGATPSAQGSFQLASTWLGAAEAIVILVDAAEAYFAAQGITPLPIPSGSGSTVLTGDVTGTEAGGIIPTTIANVNPDVGTFGSSSQAAQVTVNAKGQVTAAADVTIDATIVGDVNGSGPVTAIAVTLPTVNLDAGTFGNSSQVAQVTVNGKGQVTAAADVTIDATLTGDVTGTGPVTAVPTALAWPVTTVAGSGAAVLTRSRLQSVVVQGPGASIAFPAAPLTGDITVLSLQYSGVGAATSLTNGGGAITIENPISPGTLTTSVKFIDSATLLVYQYNGTGWVLLAKNSQVTNLGGPVSNPPNGSWTQASFFIDELNISGVASDTNTGATRGAPLLTRAELARRYGRLNPIISQVTTVLFMSVANAATQDTSPWLIEPICTENGVYIVTSDFANLAPSFTGTLNVVTPKSNTTTPGNPLEATFTTATGAMAAGLLLVNTSRANSVAFAAKSLGGGNFAISQPVGAYTPGTGANLPVPATENDAWATTDNIVGYSLPSLNIGRAGSNRIDNNGTISNGFFCQYFTVVGTSAFFGYDPMVLKEDCTFLFCLVEKAFSSPAQMSPWAGSSPLFVPRFYCCYVSNNGAAGSVSFQAGVLQTSSIGNGRWMIIDDAYLITTTTQASSIFDNGIFGHVCLDSSAIMTVSRGGPHPTQPMIFYGTGVLNVTSGLLFYSGTGTNTFRAAPRLTGVQTAYSAKTSAGVTVIAGPIALTGPNLDAAAGAAGFNGQAFNLTGCGVSNGTQN
jgi:hypothetical protein